MSAPDEPAEGGSFAPLYVLKVVLMGTKPPIWRRLQVPGDATLGWLHSCLQTAMGWHGGHLHMFLTDDASYSSPNPFSGLEMDSDDLDERKFTLQQVAPEAGDTFAYEYDFGDSWHHEITVEKILPGDAASATQAICLTGKRACPPEDCGGVWGYANLLKVLKNPKHEDHESMKEWLGRPHDAEAFDLEGTNLELRRLKWSRKKKTRTAKSTKPAK